ncbi:DNA ligase [Candidatus Parcubacteria bacterium]|nr:DNA ligase [Candidatus Parcubacteria bacterium]
MPLATYQKKRKFKETPEPKGSKSKKHKRLLFVIHKHDATRLHYDFRLEMDGTLKSWAVPKGPSLNPQDKHLAIMVEDHPYEYRNFEGVIPEGNYGAGPVIIWDEGWYTARAETSNPEKELLKGLKEGHITIVMHGKKLKGEFALVRTSPQKNWLLIKKGDEYASEDDILKKDKSVRSNRKIEDL